jgi:UTP--glucose-1-phosphate uridylyltransferase
MITKAVIPAAGVGTRLLPATKAQPKEMLPILDTPTIQYVIQEAVDSGIRDILIVTGRDKRAIEDHFDRDVELEAHLERRGDTHSLRAVRELAGLARIHYVRQPVQAGLGDAIRCARGFVGKDPFAVLLGDSVIRATVPATGQLVEAFERERCPVLGVETVVPERTHRCGIVEGDTLEDGSIRVSRLVEKPRPGETDSLVAIFFNDTATTEIYTALDVIEPGTLLGQTQMIAVPFQGRRYDVGDKRDYLKTILAFAMDRDEYRQVVESFLSSLDRGDGV